MIEDLLRQLSGKQFITLTESGDHAILAVLKALKQAGKETVLLQDQGGWLTYRDYALKAGLQFVELKTDYGVLILDELKEHLAEKAVLLVNSLSGYIAEQPMKEIYEVCKAAGVLVVNDCSGSIGTELAKIGDIILCSFGKDKPVNCAYGGFIGTDTETAFEAEFDTKKLTALEQHLKNLPARREKLVRTAEKIKKDLAEYAIIHPRSAGLNVCVQYKDESEKRKLTAYAEALAVPFVFCPRYIRVNAQAVCFEVKRL